MADRSRRARRQITEESPETSDVDSEDYDSRQPEPTRRTGRQEQQISPASRARRGAPPAAHTATSPDGKQSIKLTMKVAPSKLREVMRANEVDSLKDTLGGGTVLDGPRSRRSITQARTTGRHARPRYIEAQDSDLEDDEDEEDEEEDEEEPDAEEDTIMNDFDEVGAEAEGGTDDDDDVDMPDDSSPAPPLKKHQISTKAPKIKLTTPAKNTKQPGKPDIVVRPAADVGPVRSEEEEEMDEEEEDEEDDDDLEDESEMPDADDETGLNDNDAEGETELVEDDVEAEDEDLDEDDDDELGSSDEGEPASGAATPDPAKMTARQRGKALELMALDMAPQQRKFFTEEEKAMKKDEHARKRKELTKRKTQEEKTAALNRLLKPQVSKSRGAAPKAETLAAQMQAVAEEVEIEQKAEPLYTRWVSTKDGVKLGVPEEWLGKKVGQYFGPPLPSNNGSLVQEVE